MMRRIIVAALAWFSLSAGALGDGLTYPPPFGGAIVTLPVSVANGGTGCSAAAAACVDAIAGGTHTGTGGVVFSASPTFTGTVTAPTFSGALSGNATTATNATNITTTNDTTTNTEYFPVFQTAAGGTNPLKTSNAFLTYNPIIGRMTAQAFHVTGTGSLFDQPFVADGTFSPSGSSDNTAFALFGGAVTAPNNGTRSASYLKVAPTSFTAVSGATSTYGAALDIEPFTSISLPGGAGVTNFASLRINGAPSGATNNYSLYVVSGTEFLGGALNYGGVLLSNSVTGTGSMVLSTSPTLTTPTIGAATATTINKVTLTAPATAATLTIANNKTLTVNNSLTLAGTDSTTMTFPITSATIARIDAGQTFVGNNVDTNASGWELIDGAASGTAPTLIPNKASTTSGVGADVSGDISLAASGVEIFRSSSTQISALTAVATGGSPICATAASGFTTWKNSGGTTCALSDERAKNKKPQDNVLDANAILARIPAGQTFTWKNPNGASDKQGERIGMYAQDVCKADKRLCAFNANDKQFKGGTYNYEDRGILSLLVRANQQQQAEIDDLKRQVASDNRVIVYLRKWASNDRPVRRPLP